MQRHKKTSDLQIVLSLLAIVIVNLYGCDNAASNPFADVTGNWTGQGSGEEVRYRHRYGLLTLTVKHDVKFFFHVDKDGEIQGEGTIQYDMTSNAQGLDTLVDMVMSGLGTLPMKPKIPNSLEPPDIPDRVKEGVTSLQYEATRMKRGPELRHFKFRGQVIANDEGEPTGIRLEQYGGYRRPGRKREELDDFGENDDQQLIVTWEVNKVREESTFPCWSPFLEGGAELRRGPGNMWVAEFIESGEHREGKSMWHEFSYVWMAQRLAAE